MSSLAEKLSTRRLAGPEQEPIVLHRRRIYILPTRYGGLFTLLLLLMLIGSINYNNSLGFALTFLMGSVALVSMLHTHRNLAGLQIRCASTQSIFCGQSAVFPIIISNRNALDKISLKLEARDSDPVDINIPAASTVTANISIRSRHRGRLAHGRAKISTEYPLGLFHAWSWIHPDCDCTVYPAPEKDAPPPDFEHQGQGEGQSRQRGQDDFSGLRPYQPGDSIRSIAWKQSARGTGVYTKQFSSSGGKTLWLDWDIAETRSLEHRLSRLCQWVLHCESSGLEYGLRMPGHVLAPGKGHKHRHLCLSALALYGQGTGAS
jgi:uncharacterized protein (DUF58 family)